MPHKKGISEKKIKSRIGDPHKATKGFEATLKCFGIHQSTIKQLSIKWRQLSTVATQPRNGVPAQMT